MGIAKYFNKGLRLVLPTPLMDAIDRAFGGDSLNDRIVDASSFEFVGELGLVASILLGHLLLLITLELPHLKVHLSAAEGVEFIDTPILMSCLVFLMYLVSLPVIFAKIMILSNIENIRIIAELGATPTTIAQRVTFAFGRLIVKAILRAFAVEFIMYAMLVMIVASFTQFVIVSYPRVLALTAISALTFAVVSTLILYARCKRFAERLLDSTSEDQNLFSDE